MKRTNFRPFLAPLALALAASAAGCVTDRPSRNGVFNENQYVRKDFLIQSPDGASPDTGWMLKATVTQTSSPNPLGDQFGIFPGSENGGAYVRFKVTQDKLQMLNMREITAQPSEGRTPEVVNSWPIANVDLKYQINLDGETTNFYQENQELDWQVRQWVKINFAKNDLSDIAPFGSYYNDMIEKCTDVANASTTLETGSLVVDEPNRYISWNVNVVLPLKWDDATCVQAYGPMGDAAARLGRNTVTFNLMYSLTRADPKPTYQPLVIDEKDPIRHKYGPIEFTTINRDTDPVNPANGSGNLAARQLVMRFDPAKKAPIVWYFSPDFPAEYKKFFLDHNGIKDQTNQLLADAHAEARVDFRDFDDDKEHPKLYGDVRYNFLRWLSDRDMQGAWAGVTQFVPDPRTGETLSASISFNDFAIKDYYVQRINAYLRSVGAADDVNADAAWADPMIPDPSNPKSMIAATCDDAHLGDSVPISRDTEKANHNGLSTLYSKMQQYLNRPSATFGNLGPQDFVFKQDDDFFRAYYALIPYQIFADPAQNPFVIPEGGGGTLGPSAASMWGMLQQEVQFQQLTAKIDHGESPYEDVTGPNGLKNATDFLNNLRQLTVNHNQMKYQANFINRYRKMDTANAFSFEQIMAHDARHCVKDAAGSAPHWETRDDWVKSLITTYWSQVAWHEFGHAMGLEHNFMASVDKPNFPTYTMGTNDDGSAKVRYGMYASSVMEYNAAPDRVFWNAGWAPYDQGAISFIYANTTPKAAPTDGKPQGISGQFDSSTPWQDPHGFADDGTTERQYLFCTERHLAYTPLCRQGDIGTTPSEIIANAIDNYEWEYKWRNYRSYRKIWDDSGYPNAPVAIMTDMRKFISLSVFDWTAGEVTDSLRRIGINNPDKNGVDAAYYDILSAKFTSELSTANQMVAAFHKAVIQQSSGERPYKTIYDKYYGDVTQQGIILDKLFAMQGFVGLWPTNNYDQNQAGSYLASYSGIGDGSYQTVAEDAVDSMIGGAYDVYPYFVPLAVAQFAQDTHSPSFSGRIAVRDWIGGHVFNRLEDFLSYFRDMASQNNFSSASTGVDCTKGFDTCKYDPRLPSISDGHNEFTAPDKRLWIWAYIADRNQWVAVQRERNTASYKIVRDYTDSVVFQLDDGSFPGNAYNAQLPMKYFLDSFTQYN